jgi:signal transduction histidine kinase
MKKGIAQPQVEQLIMLIDELFRSIPAPIFLLNEDGLVEKMTPAAAEIFSTHVSAAGEEEESPFGRVVNCLHSLDDPGGCGSSPFCKDCPVRRIIRDIYATGQPCRQKEVKLAVDSPGHACYLLISAELLTLPSGRKVLLHFEDITSRKKAEEELKKEQQRLKDTLDMLPVYVLLLKPDYRVAFVNRFFRERFGAAANRPCYEYLFGRNEPCAVCQTYRVLKTNSPHTWEWAGPDNRIYSVFDFPFIDSDGSLLILEMGIDITEDKSTKEKLALTKDNLDRAQKVAHVGSWHLDLIHNNLLWTEETYRIFGLEPGTPVNYGRFLQMVHPADREYVDGQWRAALTGKPYEIEHRIIVNGEIKWIREIAEVETDKRGKPLRGIGTVQDITGYKQQEDDNIRLQRELLHVSRVTAMGELTAALAHELNQPLMAIISNVQAAQRFLAPGADAHNPDLDEIREILTDVVKDSKRAADIIHKLRALFKKSPLKPVVLDINAAIREILPLMQSNALIKNVSLGIELAPELPPVKGDRVQLQQVIVNLILNGFEAMTGEEEKQLTIGTAAAQKAVTVSISDTGSGITARNPEDLFKPFYTTKKSGMGMGLAVNKTIIEAHGGTLWAKNNRGPGATFSFTLPVCEEE